MAWMMKIMKEYHYIQYIVRNIEIRQIQIYILSVIIMFIVMIKGNLPIGKMILKQRM